MKKEDVLKNKEEIKKELNNLYTDILKEMCNKNEYLYDNFWQRIKRFLDEPCFIYHLYEFELSLARIDYACRSIDEKLCEKEKNEYIDNREKEFNEQTKALREMLEQYDALRSYLDSDIDRLIDMEMEFDGDIIITDPCYIMKNHDDWAICACGEKMDILGFTRYMTRDTLYGDWSCTTYNLDTNEEIGSFCADAGLVGVFLLDEVMKYNPDYNDVKDNHWSVTCIRDFKGTVEFKVEHIEGIYEETTEYWEAGDKWEENVVKVYGHGVNKVTGKPINFVGTQTGL